MHLNSKLLFKKYPIKYFDKKFRVLEIGPDFPSVFQQLTLSITPHWDTLDIYDNKSLTYPNSNPYNFPIDANSYDIIFSAQVLEHVRMPWKWMPELARVCKKGGLIITINPVSWPYHEEPVDCWRIYPEGMRALSEESNLTVLESHWESLEVTPHIKRYKPGASREFQGKKWHFVYGILGRLGLPVERAYDTITIARKNYG